MERLTKDTILRAFELLATELPADVAHSIVISGGAALVLLYGARDATKDVDALFATRDSKQAVQNAARRVAGVLRLPDDWINDGAKGYYHGVAMGALLFERPNLVVHSLAPEQLLAMKLSAWRDDIDVEDARLLLSKLTGERGEIWRRVEAHLVPGRELKARYAFDDLWEAGHGSA